MEVGIKLLTVLFLVATAGNPTWAQRGGRESTSAAPRLGGPVQGEAGSMASIGAIDDILINATAETLANTQAIAEARLAEIAAELAVAETAAATAAALATMTETASATVVANLQEALSGLESEVEAAVNAAEAVRASVEESVETIRTALLTLGAQQAA